MKFGVQCRIQDPPTGENMAQRLQEALKAAEVAEAAGFDGFFLPEHHNVPDGYLSNPWALLGALSERTSRIDIGTTIMTLPLRHPMHVAEAAAVADLLSGGRLRLAVGLGGVPRECAFFGIDRKDQVGRLTEAIDLLRRAWRGEDLDHEGKYFSVHGRLSPLPREPELSPEIWYGAMSEPAVRRAARFGMPWLTDSLHTIATLSEWKADYDAAGGEHGTTQKLQVFAMREGWLADSMDEVERDWWPHLRRDHYFYFSQMPRFDLDREPSLRGVEQEHDLQFGAHHVDRLIVGNRADCIEKIRSFESRLGVEYMILSFRLSGGPSFEAELDCIERFGREVIPAFGADCVAAA